MNDITLVKLRDKYIKLYSLQIYGGGVLQIEDRDNYIVVYPLFKRSGFRLDRNIIVTNKPERHPAPFTQRRNERGKKM